MSWRTRCSVLLLLAFTAGAQSVLAQNVLVNYGAQWSSWSSPSRSIWTQGFVDGQSSTYLALLTDLPEARRDALRLKTFTFYDSDALRDVMTSLYADPANTYIRFDAMVYIARDKLSGKDVEPTLRTAREKERGIRASPAVRPLLELGA